QLTAECDGAFTAGSGVVEGLDDAAAIVDFFSRRPERGVDFVDLGGMNQRHPRESQAPRLQGELLQSFHVLEIWPDTIHCLHMRGSRSRYHRRPGIDEIDGFTFAAKRKAELPGEVFRSEIGRAHV